MSEALAEDGNYSAVGFTYGSDYYDPSEPTEEEEPSKQRGEGKGTCHLSYRDTIEVPFVGTKLKARR